MARVDRDRVLAAIDLPLLADELLGPRRGQERSGTWPCPSARHAQTGRTPPVSIFATAGGEQRWHCHGCGVGGTAVDLLMAVRGVPVRHALEELAARAGISPGPFVDATPRRPIERPLAARSAPPPGDLAGLAVYVEECANRLWRPEGRPVLDWLTRVRRLPADVLWANRVGADPGRHHQARPDGMPSAGWAAVLPVHEDGRVVFAQLRALGAPSGRPRYLNAAGRLALNPRVAMYVPPAPVGACVIVTEGAIDALSANAAGFPAAAVLGAALACLGSGTGAGNPVVDRLAATPATLVVAFDADVPGNHAGRCLTQMLRDRGARVARLQVPFEANDLNGWLYRSPDWQSAFQFAVRAAVHPTREARRTVSR